MVIATSSMFEYAYAIVGVFASYIGAFHAVSKYTYISLSLSSKSVQLGAIQSPTLGPLPTLASCRIAPFIPRALLLPVDWML